jgi:hypothetical protein
MPGKTPMVFLFLLVWSLIQLHGQQLPLRSKDIEDILYRDESSLIPETLLQDFQEYLSTPLDLNAASLEELEASALFSSYQVYNLIKYREKFGSIYSIYELINLSGFNPSYLIEIAPFVKFSSELIPKVRFKGKHMLMINTEQAFPLNDQYRVDPGLEDNSGFTGSPLKTSIRIRSQPWERLSMALSYEKDAGELFLYRNKPQFLSGYLSYKGKGIIKQLVIGDFQLNQGAGLVNGSGFIHKAGDFHVNRQSLSRIRPYASLTESGYEQGGACKIGTKNFLLLLWASYHKISLSPAAFGENPQGDKWLDFQRTSGLHRNKNELEGRDLVYRIHCGIQLLYTYRKLTFGILHGKEWIGPSNKAMTQLEVKPQVPPFQKISLHGNWSKRQFQIFGELSASQFSSLAFLLGSSVHFNDFVHGNLLLHHYGHEYQGSLPSSYGSGSDIKNEQGLAINLQVETGKLITAELTAEVFRYPMPRYLTTVPSGAYSLDLSLHNPGSQMLEWRARIYSKTWQSTEADENSRIRLLKDHRVNRLDGQLTYNHDDIFKWQSRLVIGYSSSQNKPAPAYAAVQQLTLSSSVNLKVSAQLVLFHVCNWDNRIYLYEPGFYYSFNFPVYYGSGQKTTLLFTYKPTSGITIASKLSILRKSENRTWDLGIQLRLRF